MLTGGTLGGHIGGQPDAPAKLDNLTVQANATLSNVVLGEHVTLDPTVNFAGNVRFTNLAQVPQGRELLSALPELPGYLECAWNVTGIPRRNLNADVVDGGPGLLPALNQLPVFKDNGWSLGQDWRTGNLQVDVEQFRYAVQAVSLQRTQESAGARVLGRNRVQFVTHTGFKLLAQPALQAPCALQASLVPYGLNRVQVQTNGNLKIPANDRWFSARPDWLSQVLMPDSPRGLFVGPSAYGPAFPLAKQVFTDGNGQARQQLLYPALAQPELLEGLYGEVLTLLPDGGVLLPPDGVVGVADYAVLQGQDSVPEFRHAWTGDLNGDGVPDLDLSYPGYLRQGLFWLAR